MPQNNKNIDLNGQRKLEIYGLDSRTIDSISHKYYTFYHLLTTVILFNVLQVYPSLIHDLPFYSLLT